MILGDTPVGKTCVLHFEASRLANDVATGLRGQRVALDNSSLPILANLADLNTSDDELEQALVRGATELLISTANFTEARLRWCYRLLQDKLHKGACVVLLDGWECGAG